MQPISSRCQARERSLRFIAAQGLDGSQEESSPGWSRVAPDRQQIVVNRRAGELAKRCDKIGDALIGACSGWAVWPSMPYGDNVG